MGKTDSMCPLLTEVVTNTFKKLAQHPLFIYYCIKS